jgi:hypothetical protein
MAGMKRLTLGSCIPLAVAAILLLSGCHPTASPSTTSTAGSSSTPSTTPTATGGGSGGGSGSAAACTRDDLKITYQATDNTAGQFHGVLTFTNISSAACIMNGYPVVYLGQPEAEQTMGAASTNDTTSTPALVTVPAGGTAHAATTITDAGAVCQPVDTTYLLASPPLDHPFDAPTDGQHVYDVDVPGCNDPSVSLVRVGAVTG